MQCGSCCCCSGSSRSVVVVGPFACCMQSVWVLNSCGCQLPQVAEASLPFFLLLIDLSCCCCCCLCMVFFYKTFKQLPSILFATYVAFLCCCLPFYFSQRFVDFVVEAEGGRGGEAEDIFMLRWARQTSWCVRCERRTTVSIYICTCIICVSFAAAVSICTTNCLNS